MPREGGLVRRYAGDRASLPSPNPSANSVGGCRGRNGEPPLVATPQAVLTHVHEHLAADLVVGRRTRRAGRVRAGLLIGATPALTVTALPGTAAALPGEATTAADAA